MGGGGRKKNTELEVLGWALGLEWSRVGEFMIAASAAGFNILVVELDDHSPAWIYIVFKNISVRQIPHISLIPHLVKQVAQW